MDTVYKALTRAEGVNKAYKDLERSFNEQEEKRMQQAVIIDTQGQKILDLNREIKRKKRQLALTRIGALLALIGGGLLLL